MVNFSIQIAISVLTLVVCGAHGDSTQSDGMLNATIDTVVSYMENAQAELDGMMKNLTKSATNVTSWMNSTVQSQLGQYDEKSANLSMNATSDTSSCTSLGVDLKKDSGDIISNFISCIDWIVNDVHYNYNKTSRAFQHVIDTLKDIVTTGGTKCASDIYGCVKEMLSTNFTDIPIDVGSMALHGGSLAGQVTFLQPSFVGCGAVAATQSVVKKSEDALAALGECLSNSTSTSS